jgi:hypothetical protein
MAGGTRVIFAKKKVEKAILAPIIAEQTRRLIAYAERTIGVIGASINNYHGANHMDRTGTLLDSLCWGVYYGGKAKKVGYYRSSEAYENSHLHEWQTPKGEEIDGHLRAAKFINSYNPQSHGWEVFFAVLAPYWGYWEKGHRNIRNGRFQHFAVMTQYYDVVKKDLSPAKVTFKNYVPR